MRSVHRRAGRPRRAPPFGDSHVSYASHVHRHRGRRGRRRGPGHSRHRPYRVRGQRTR
ncbi:hypothetical protein SCOCK_810018 [Actinacidiphila cocklensis]|uniref:Uncharacterized protein n=1 Tax=Actinacidiphila cocklensis TaxID=887465 RepID=A0A9W4GVD5_9ACTN|nr:hypothetical protein SCOCK_810018 [Actinacidiphila cocklensis]